MAEYTLESRTRDGRTLFIFPFRNLQGEFYKSKSSTIRWEVPLKKLEASTSDFYPGKTEVALLRDDKVVFVGPLWEVNVSSNDSKVSFSASSLDSYFNYRRISADVTYTDSYGNIAWLIMQASQAMPDGNLGIVRGQTVGAGAPSGTVKYTYREGKNIYNVLTELTDMSDGFDWEITPERVYNQIYPKINTRSRISLEYGGSVTNYSVQNMGGYAANDVLVQGPDKTFAHVVDPIKRAEYGLRQYTTSNTSLKSATTLNHYAEFILSQRKDNRIVPQVVVRSDLISPFDGDLSYGQIVPVVIEDGWVNVNQDMRCVGYQLTLGKHGEETFAVYLEDLREVE